MTYVTRLDHILKVKHHPTDFHIVPVNKVIANSYKRNDYIK